MISACKFKIIKSWQQLSRKIQSTLSITEKVKTPDDIIKSLPVLEK